MLMQHSPFAAPSAALPYSVRDRVAVSDKAAVLVAPDQDKSLNLAIWTDTQAPALPRFFASSHWQAGAYQLFKPLLVQADGGAVAPGAKIPLRDRGFFPVTAEGDGIARVADGQRRYSVNHSSGDTHFLFMGDFWCQFAQRAAQPEHPLLQHISRRRDAIKEAFGVAKVDVELRFETARIGAPVGTWHPDADRGRLISTVAGSETEYLREPFVRRDALRATTALQARNANSKSLATKLAVATRELLGPRFDYTRFIATDTARVETMQRGHLARMTGGLSVSEGKAECSLIHRRPRAWFKDRVVEMYYPHLK